MSYQFQGQRPHERVMLLTHQHPFVLIKSALIVVLFLLLPFAVYAVSPTGNFLALSVAAGLILAIIKANASWYSWNHTLFILTTERIIFLEQRGIFKRELVELPLNSVHQVSHTVNGVLRTFFGFGTVSVAALGTHEAMKITNVPDPYVIQEEILRTQHGEGFIEEEESDDE